MNRWEDLTVFPIFRSYQLTPDHHFVHGTGRSGHQDLNREFLKLDDQSLQGSDRRRINITQRSKVQHQEPQAVLLLVVLPLGVFDLLGEIQVEGFAQTCFETGPGGKVQATTEMEDFDSGDVDRLKYWKMMVKIGSNRDSFLTYPLVTIHIQVQIRIEDVLHETRVRLHTAEEDRANAQYHADQQTDVDRH